MIDIAINTKVKFKGKHGICRELSDTPYVELPCQACILYDECTDKQGKFRVACSKQNRADHTEVFFPELKV